MKRYWIGIAVLTVLVGCGGQKAPTMEAEPLDDVGHPVSLASFKGKSAVVMDFWATWCGPCKESLPHFQSLYEKYGKKVQFMMITQEDRSEVRPFLKDMKLTAPCFIDTSGAANRAFNVDAIPFSVVIDKEGKVVWSGNPLDDVAFSAAVEAVSS